MATKIIITFIIGNLLIAGGIFCLIYGKQTMDDANTLTSAEKSLQAKINAFDSAVANMGDGAITYDLVPAKIGNSYPINTVSRIPLRVEGGAKNAISYTLNTIVTAGQILNASAATNPTGIAQPIAFNLAHTTTFYRSEIPLSKPNTTSDALCYNATVGCNVGAMNSYCTKKYGGGDVVYVGNGCPIVNGSSSASNGFVCGECVYTAYLSSYCAVIKAVPAGHTTTTTTTAAPTTTTTTSITTTATTATEEPTTAEPTNTTAAPLVAMIIGDGNETTTAAPTTTTTVAPPKTTAAPATTTTEEPTTTTTEAPLPAYTFIEDTSMPSCRYPFTSDNFQSQRYLSTTMPMGVLFQVFLNVDPNVVLERVTDGADTFGPNPFLPSDDDVNDRWRENGQTIALLVIGALAVVMGVATVGAGIVACRSNGGCGNSPHSKGYSFFGNNKNINDAYSQHTLSTVNSPQENLLA